MAFSRFNRFRRFRRSSSFGNRRRRFGTSTRRLHPPSKWQWGNFRLSAEILLNSSTPTFNQMTLMARAENLVNPSGSDAGETAMRLTLNRSVRAIEIGGLVWTQGIDNASNWSSSPVLSLNQQLLVMDRIDADGAPASVLYDFAANTQPVTTSGLDTTEDADAPIRIIDRWADQLDHEWRTGVTTTEPGFPGMVQTNRNRRMRSLRLRARILPDFGLYWFATSRLVNATPVGEDFTIRHWIVGSIYYRWVM